MAIKASWIKTKVFLLVIMVTPLVLLVVLGSAKHNFFPLPVFGNEKDGSQIPMFPANVEFHDQQGIEINADFFNDQIVVVGYQFIDCKYKCTEAPRRLMKLQYEYRKATNVHMVQMIIGNKDKQTIDNFTTKYHIGDQWHVLTAPSVNDSILLNHRKSIIDCNKENLSASSYKHQQQMILYDLDHRIRGYYNTSDSTEVNKMMDDIKVLKTEEWRKRKANEKAAS